MIRSLAIGSAAICLAGSPVFAQDRERVDDPPECHWPVGQPDNWQGCLDAATIGSLAYVTASMNLGTLAFLERDYATAAGFYDQTIIEGQTFMSDPFLHAFRAATFEHVGRGDDALKDALLALRFLEVGSADLTGAPLDDPSRAIIYENVLETLARADAPELAGAVEAYAALPAPTWYDAVNRSAVFTEIGLYDRALPFSETALAEQPEHPAALNNHCFLLAMMGDGETAIPYCTRALEALPDEATIHDSLAEALQAAGDCEAAAASRRRASELAPESAHYAEPMECETR